MFFLAGCNIGFYLLFWPGGGGRLRSHLATLIPNISYPRRQGTDPVVLLTMECIPIIHSGTSDMAPGWIRGPRGPTVS